MLKKVLEMIRKVLGYPLLIVLTVITAIGRLLIGFGFIGMVCAWYIIWGRQAAKNFADRLGEYVDAESEILRKFMGVG